VFLHGGNVFGRSTLDTVDVSGDPLSYRFIVTNQTHPPHTPLGYLFDDFEFWSPVSDQALVFGGASTKPSHPYIYGIYAKAGEAGDLTRLVDSNTLIPQGTGNFGNFSWFGTHSPIVASNGVVVFGALDSAGNAGLYAVKETGGWVRKIIAKGDAINGFTVDSLNIGREALDGTTLVFSVNYASFQGSGLYSTQVTLP